MSEIRPTIVPDDAFKLATLTTLVAGLGLYVYTNFFTTRSVAVEWKAGIKRTPDSDDDSSRELKESEPYKVQEWISGRTTWEERLYQRRSHQDIVDRVFQLARNDVYFADVEPDQIAVDIVEINVL